jgi:hypothetical protein
LYKYREFGHQIANGSKGVIMTMLQGRIKVGPQDPTVNTFVGCLAGCSS